MPFLVITEQEASTIKIPSGVIISNLFLFLSATTYCVLPINPQAVYMEHEQEKNFFVIIHH